jgi:uncharacterized peroxidase-related enzyme
MSRLPPLSLTDLPDQAQKDMAFAQDLMGFIPNDVLAMAHWPELLSAVKALVDVIYAPGALDPGLKRMMATIVSGAAGCRYCQAHTAHGAVRMAGVDQAKISAVWDYQSNPLFSEAERAALNLALAAGQQPNAVTDEHFAQLRHHFSERAVVEMMGVIGLFGFLNRWNDTLATELEEAPLAFAETALRPQDWTAGHHRWEKEA